MFTRKTFVALALLVGIGGAYSVAQVQKNKVKVAPLSSRDKKIQKCELHGTALKLDNVPISYGIVGFPGGYYQASQKSFPHAHSRVMGGCIVSSDSPKKQIVKYCSQCRIAEKRWAQNHRRTVSTR